MVVGKQKRAPAGVWAPVLCVLCVLCILALAAPAPASGGSKRVALLVAHPFGGDGLTPLRYTANDLERMREVLELLGGFLPEDLIISYGQDADEVVEHFEEARERLEQADGTSTLFLFYYSGHAKEGELRLGESRLSLLEAKRLTEETGADMRFAFLDACRSGAITHLKGASKGDPIVMGVEDSLAHKGQVMVAASSASEDAQESDAIGGSFFTYFLTTGLRGAADKNGDGGVTLSEAYSYAYAHTVSSTVGTRGGIQHPTYRFDLRGAGEVVLTRPGDPVSRIAFPKGVAGHFVVFDTARQMVVAEFDKADEAEARVAVEPGDYVVKKRETDHLRMQRLAVPPMTTAWLVPGDMEEVAFADDYAKGVVITAEELRHGRVGIRLSAALGAQAFLSAPARAQYFPGMGLLHLRLDLHNLLRRYLGFRLDLGLGSSGKTPLVVSDPYLGSSSYTVDVSELTTGVALTATLPLTSWLEAGIATRVGFIVLQRDFLGADLPDQVFSTLTPGLEGELSVHLTDWLRAGLGMRVHYMFFNMDEPQSLAYIDGGLVMMAVLR